MRCPNCGKPIEGVEAFCPKCGTALDPSSTSTAHTQTSEKDPERSPGRGGLILSLGIISLFLFGPILGIPAWIMGRRDLKKIREGRIDASQQGKTTAGMILGIISTFLVGLIYLGIAIAVVLALATAQDVNANRDAIIADIVDIAADAHEYRNRSFSLEGGEGSYIGYVLPLSLAANENATYMVMVSPDKITIRGTSASGYGDVMVQFDKDGKREGPFEFTGQFQ